MIIKYLAFRGTGKFDKNIGKIPALIIAGHVGLQFEDDPAIYGFHPTAEAEKDAGGEKALVDLLKAHLQQPACVQDDTEIFLRALKENLKVVYDTYDFTTAEYHKIKETLDQWYNFPFPEEEGGFPEGQYNCSTFPLLLGIQVPDESGYIRNVIENMKEALEWEP